jgi:hypothetical protein
VYQITVAMYNQEGKQFVNLCRNIKLKLKKEEEKIAKFMQHMSVKYLINKKTNKLKKYLNRSVKTVETNRIYFERWEE